MNSVYYSKSPSSLWFVPEWDGPLRITGKGVLKPEDAQVHNPDKDWNGAFCDIKITEPTTEIYGGFLEAFKSMTYLRLPKSVTEIHMTDGLRQLLCQNKVTINAAYGSIGEKIAEENGLIFHPTDILLCWEHDSRYNESVNITLRFLKNGETDIFYDHITQGASAGSNSGASKSEKMPEGYYRGCSISEFADLFPPCYHEQIINNRELKIFLEKQKRE